MFRVLCRALFDQLFAADTAAAENYVRQRAVYLGACLAVPCIFILMSLYPAFADAAIRVRVGRAPASYLDDMLEWVSFVLITYSAVGVGFIAVMSWDALTFDRRDAMVLGPLPIPWSTMMAAKLGALGLLLGLGAVPINFVNSAFFAIETADQLGARMLVPNFFALLVATMGASLFTFASVVGLRAIVAVLTGARAASALGPPLQCLFVVCLVCVVTFSPAVGVSLMGIHVTNWLPPAWFVGVFEFLRGSPRRWDPEFEFLVHARRAAMATPIAVIVATAASVVEFRRQMQLTLSPHGVRRFEWDRFPRALARALAGRDRAAKALSEFVLITFLRIRSIQTPLAITTGVGGAIVIGVLSRRVRTFDALMHPRPATLWVPLVLAYSLALGLRSSFAAPGELSAGWIFRAAGTDRPATRWSAIRAAMIALVLPPTVVGTAAWTAWLIGWRIAAWHVAYVSLLTLLFTEATAATVTFIPFTKARTGAGGRGITRWPIYALGLYFLAYKPIHYEVWLLNQPPAPPLVAIVVVPVVMALAALEVWGRLTSHTEAAAEDEMSDEVDHAITALNLSTACL